MPSSSAQPRRRALVLGFASLLGASIACNVFVTLGHCESDGDCPTGSTCDPQGKFCLGKAESGLPDSGGDASDAADAGDAPPDVIVPSCDLTKPFQDPQLVKGLDKRTVFSARFTPDERTAYISALEEVDGAVQPILYTSTRDDLASPFQALLPLQVNRPGLAHYWPTVTADGKFLFFESDRSQDGGDTSEWSRIWFSEKGFDFGTAKLQTVFATKTNFVEGAPYLDPKGRAIYFMSAGRDPDGGVSEDLYESILDPMSGAAGTPKSLGSNINTVFEENAPVVTADQLTLYFARADLSGPFDIWTSRRANPLANFGTASIVGELNTEYEEFSSYVSDDQCRFYFVSGRPLVDGGASGFDTFRLYVAKRAR